MLQSPSALFIIKYHNLSPAGAVEAGGTWRIQKYSKWQDSLCSLQEEIYLKAGGGCILWPLLFSLTVKNGCWPPLPPLFNWGFSGPRSVLSLGIQNDTGAVLFFSALESGVSLLQILYHRQQPSCNALT